MSQRAAVLESVRTRIRPIFMTAFIGFFGLVPLVISPGAGSELYQGLGSVLLGGLLVSTIFTLFLVPSLFTLTLETKTGLVRWLTGERSEPEPVPHIPAAARAAHDGNGNGQAVESLDRAGRANARGQDSCEGLFWCVCLSSQFRFFRA